MAARTSRPAGEQPAPGGPLSWRLALLVLCWPAAAAAAPAEGQPAGGLRVAAFASKLEHWFACHQLSQAVEASSAAPHCAAHFDGHLCWPRTSAGRTLELACPRLAWLAGGQSLGSVIDRSLRPAANASSPEEAQEPTASRSCNLMLGGRAAEWQAEPAVSYQRCARAASGAFDPTDDWVKLEEEADDRRLFASLVDELARIEATIDPYGDPDLLEQWTMCIGNTMQRQASGAAAGPANCPIIFDGWRCWPETRAGETAYVSCPKNQPGFSAERKAHKICTPEATWYKHPMTNRFWSNYTTCVDTVDLAFRTKILNLYVIGNLISLVALAASLIVFLSFKSLNCTRVTIHKNLFLSFITNNLMWIIWYTCVVNDADLLQSNPIECQVWHVLLHYFLVSNYFWMFCEGLYLHTILVVAFVSEDKILKWFYLLGWLTPIPITLAYAYNRAYDPYYTNFCWMEESPHNLILMAPIGVSLLLNLVFLINIVRVLVTKLRANNSPDTHQTRKAVRATLILIPLLGLHYMLTPFRPEAKSEWEVIYEIIAAVCTSFQGLCVAMLFCFCNGEVIAAIRKRLKLTFNLRGSNRSGYLHEQASQPSRGRLNSSSLHTNQFSSQQPKELAAGAASSLKSVVLASGGAAGNDLIFRTSTATNGQRSNGSTSNSSSLLTTVTVSPVQTASGVVLCETSLHQGDQLAVNLLTNQTKPNSNESETLR